MKSLIDLQRALLADDPDGVSAFFDEENRKSANEAMLAASKALGFKVAFLDGWLVTTGAEISRLMGHTTDSSIREMRRKYRLNVLSPTSSGREMTKLREAFVLHPNDGRTVFYGWDVLLCCAMRGRTPEAEKLQIYLLDCERALRVASQPDADRKRRMEWAEIRELSRAITTIRKAPDDPLTQLLRQRVEAVLGGPLPIPQNGRLALVDPPPAGPATPDDRR